MRTLMPTVVGVLALAALAASPGADAEYAPATEPAAERKAVNCSTPPYRNAIRGSLDANLSITAYSTVCVVKGRVTGDVTVRRTDRRCGAGSKFVALSLEGGTIDGRVIATGRRCVMVWLYDGAVVKGDIAYRAAGNLGFLGDRSGARVRGDVLVEGGHLWATGRSRTNRVAGDLVCDGGAPAGLPRLATRTNWDGAGRDETDESADVDGTIGGRYAGCQKAR